MDEFSEILSQVKISAKKKRLFTPHALRQMSRPDRMITTSEVTKVISTGIVIENYLNDHRGQSCLILGYGMRDRPIHIVCSPKDEYLAIITAYIPRENEWENDYKTRREI